LIEISNDLIQNLEKITVIYTDVDGTLVTNGCLFCNQDGFTMGNARAVFQLLSAGVDVVMTSGPEKEKLKDTARLLGFQNYIANLGIEIVYNQGEKVLTNFGIDVPDHESLKKWIKSSGVLETLFDRFPGKISFYEPWADILRTHYLMIGELSNQELDRIFNDQYPDLRIIDNGEVPPYKQFSQPHTYHILPKSVGKRSAVQTDKRERKLNKKNLIGIGDSLEDMSMAHEVGIFFLLDDHLPIQPPNIIRVNNSQGEGFSQIVDFLAEKKLI
jgi:HAD superfamily hydrolase (TIGR01484 family)